MRSRGMQTRIDDYAVVIEIRRHGDIIVAQNCVLASRACICYVNNSQKIQLYLLAYDCKHRPRALRFLSLSLTLSTVPSRMISRCGCEKWRRGGTSLDPEGTPRRRKRERQRDARGRQECKTGSKLYPATCSQIYQCIVLLRKWGNFIAREFICPVAWGTKYKNSRRTRNLSVLKHFKENSLFLLSVLLNNSFSVLFIGFIHIY